MSNITTRRQIRLIARARRRLRRGVMSVTSVVATAAMVVTGLAAGAAAATALPGMLNASAASSSVGVDFGDYTGPRIVQVAPDGEHHVLALDEDGGVWAWGHGGNRQLDGVTTTYQSAPVQVTTVTDLLDDGEEVVQLMGSYRTSYALTSEGRVISWGYSGYSALGRTTTTPAPDFVQRDASTELTGIVKIDASRYSVLALDEDGHVWVWGYNGYGQLGIGTTATQRYAVQIPAESLSDVTDISAGNASSLAVSNGVVKAWGYNAGYLGVGNNTYRILTPTDVVTTSGMTAEITQVSSGMNGTATSYAIDVNGELWSWGDTRYGANGHSAPRGVPSRVLDTDDEPLTGVTQVTSGNFTGYAVANGTVYAWGLNNYGQLGNDSRTNASRATPVNNFDLDGAIGGVESIAAGWHHLAIVSTVGDDDGVVSMTGNYYANGLVTANGGNDNVNRWVPTLVWRYQQAFKALPEALIPRSGEATQQAGAAGFPTGPQQVLAQGTGTFNYGVEPFELTQTTDGPEGGSAPVDFRLTGYCSLNANTDEVSIVRGDAACYIYRSFDGNAFVAPLVQERWLVAPGRLEQDIADFGTDEEQLFEGLTAESAPVALPIYTDAPAERPGLRYTVDPASRDVCQITYSNGSNADNVLTNAQRYLTVLGDGDCTVTVRQAGNIGTYAPLEKTVDVTIGLGRGPQAVDLSSLEGIRFADPEPEFDLPTQTDKDQDVTYTYVSGPCEVDGTTLTATGAGLCVVTAAADEKEGDNLTGALPYEQNLTIQIGKGIQTLDSIVGELATLESANSDSAELPETSNQGLALNWDAATADDSDFVDACSYIAGENLVRAGEETERDLGDGVKEYAECTITAQNDGDADWEAFSYELTTEISERELQNLSLAALDGKKFGDDDVTLPAQTDEGQDVTYTASGSCTVEGNTVSINSGGACIVTATAPGTTSDSDPGAGPWYRPLSITTTAPVATIGQYLSGMPNLTGIAVGATTRPLPTTTVQEQTLIWSAGPSSACEIVDGRIVVLSDSPCTLTGEADGNENYSDFVFEQTFTGVPNTDALEDAIAHALPDETSGDFTSGSWGDYQEALQAAKDLLTRDDPVVTQAEVDAALEALAAAKDALVDLSALRALVNEAVTDESSYTPETWSDYVDALEGAQETLNDARATDDEVAAALEALVEAEEKLVHRADFTELGQVVGLVDALPANGTVDGEFDYDGWDGLGDAYDALQAELGEGRAVFDDKNSTQDEIDAAAGELREALAQVESAMELAEAIVEIDDLNLEESNYTEDSWKVLTDALAAADAALDTTPLPDQETLEQLRNDLHSALGGLEFTPQFVPGLAEAVDGPHAIGDEPVALPTTTDRGATVSYTIDPASAGICELVDGRLFFTGFGGDCIVNWSAPAIGNFPAATGSEQAVTGPGIQLVVDGRQVLDGEELEAGQSLIARGGGLEPGTELRVELRPGDEVLGTAVVDIDGTATVTFTIPDGIRPGDYTVTALGVSTVDGSALTRSADVAVSNLAFTGADVLPIGLGALALLLAGLGALLIARRRPGRTPAA